MSEKIRLQVNGIVREIEVIARERTRVLFSVAGRSYDVSVAAELPDAPASTSPSPHNKPRPRHRNTKGAAVRESAAARGVTAPIPGVVVAVLVNVGDTVQEGQVVIRLEAMKMENNIFAPFSGSVGAVHVESGEEVRDGQLLLEIAP